MYHLNNRLIDFLHLNEIIHKSQIAFLEKSRTADHLFTLKTLINKSVHNTEKGKLYACFVDFKKAYDSVWHKGLFHKLDSLGINGTFSDLIKDMYSKTLCSVKIENNRTRYFNYTKGVRQGCPLSPLLFNIFINELAGKLCDTSSSPITLPNGTELNCLIYADDIVILSRSPDGLQHKLDNLKSYCNNWGMNLNIKKTKCLTFQKKNKVEKRQSFAYGEHKIENVASYTYLGMTISANGSFHMSTENLCSKAKRAIFAINNRFPLKQLPVKIALKLFDSAIAPILLYGSEVFSLFTYMDYAKWDNCNVEKVHLNFCKHLLGVNRTTTNNLVRGELGRYPLKININFRIKSFFDHIMNSNKDDLVYQAFKINEELPFHLSCRTYLQNLDESSNKKFSSPVSKNTFKSNVKSSYIDFWKKQVSHSKKGEFLTSIKKEFGLEPYLAKCTNRSLRILTTKLRLSDHQLSVEVGRRKVPKVPRENRICEMCNNSLIETEFHFLAECSHYSLARRKLFDGIYSKFPQVKYLSMIDQIQFIFICEEEAIIANTLELIRDSFIKRKTTVESQK